MQPPPLSDDEVNKIVADVEDRIRYRLRMTEIIPIEMSKYTIGSINWLCRRYVCKLKPLLERGRVRFAAPRLFETSLCLRGAQKDDGWFFVDVEFLFNVGGDETGMQGTTIVLETNDGFHCSGSEFPRVPTGVMKRHITEGVDAQLAMYVPITPPPEGQVPPVELPPRPQLPEGTMDAPLVRVYNFLRKFRSNCEFASVHI